MRLHRALAIFTGWLWRASWEGPSELTQIHAHCPRAKSASGGRLGLRDVDELEHGAGGQKRDWLL